MWQQAFEWIGERPVVGWGPKTREHLFKSDEFPPQFHDSFGHFHNNFLGLWVAYGALGFAVFAGVAVMVGHSAWAAWRAHLLPTEVLLFGFSFFIYWLVVNLFESYFNYSTGTYTTALVAGSLYGYRIRRLQSEANSGDAVDASSE